MGAKFDKFKGWWGFADADDSQQTFSEEGGPYTPVATYITEAMNKFGSGSVSRQDALQVPAVLRGRNMICNIATLPIRQLDTKRKVVRDTLFEQFNPQVPNVVHLAMTVEDLLMEGIAWWKITRRDANNWPKDVEFLDQHRVSVKPPPGYQTPLPSGFDPNSTIWVDGKPARGADYIRFDSPNPPLLLAAKRAIRRAILLEELAAMYADNPGLSDYFTPANGMEAMDEEQIRTILQSWVASRKKKRTGYVPETLEHHVVQSPNPVDLQLVQLQEKASLDIANALGVDPEDLGVSTTSRTYQNATDRRQDRVNDVLSAFMKAITDRLSMRDVTRNGYRVVFDLDDYMRADPKTRWETHKIAKDLGATDVKEIREREDWVERDDLDTPEPEPEPVEPVEEPAEDTVVPSGNQMKGSLMKHSMPASFSAEAPSIDAAQTFQFGGEAVTFAADAEKRTITGTALLYNVTADNGWGKFTFAPGALEWKKSAVSRVKFLRDHDWGQLLGSATKITDDGDTVTTSFKVARGAEGDRALELAEDGALDGLSVGIDIVEWEEDREGNFTVTRAILNEVSLTPRPAFEDARLTKVTASKQDKKNPEEEFTVVDEKTPDAPADTKDDNLDERIAAAVAAALSKVEKDNKPEAPAPVTEKPAEKAPEVKLDKAPKEEEKAVEVNPVRETPTAKFEVREKSPYTFDGVGRFAKGEHEFSTDIVEMLKSGDFDGTKTDAGKRAMGHISQAFVATGDVDELNPAVNRPQDYYETRAARTPLWNMIDKGALPEGVRPFIVPKFSSATGLVGDHTQGVEPTPGTFVTTSQTITPTAVSGKVTINREVWDLGGSPVASNLIWNRMVREYYQALETASKDFLVTLTAAADITLTAGAVNKALAASLASALVELQFADQYEFSAFALEKVLYSNLANAVDDAGRPLFPAIGATNANGTVGNLFQSLNVNGVRGVPAGKLPSTPGAANKSYLFDPEVVLGWSSAPQRLEFAGSTATPDANSYAPVAGIDLAIWGYKAFANTDIGGVREVIYDSVA